MRLFHAALCLSLLALSGQAQANILAPRIFDIVPPEGREVKLEEGYTVLRQPGEKYGAVVSFVPESGLTAWVPVAVLNTGDAPLKVRQKDIRAHYGETPLKVYDNAGLVREYTRRRQEMLAYNQHGADGKTLRDLVASNRSLEDGLRGGGLRSSVTDSRGSRVGDPKRQEGNSDAREAKRLADAQLEALKERLFRDAEIEPGRFNRGEVRVQLPPRREDGPTEFVLTLDFGGEQMPVLFRERDGSSVEVGELGTPAD